MNRSRIAFTLISLVVFIVFAASIIKIRSVSALDDATTTEATTSEATTTDGTAPDATATDSTTDTPTISETDPGSSTNAADASPATSTPAEPALTEQPAVAPQGAAPSPLTLVRIIGTKYIDYCTDGTNITAYPGDPAIAANFDKPDAPIPMCPPGQKWHHTSGMPAYDTTSGDLGVNQYAVQDDGTYIVHYPAVTYTDATSTKQWSDRVTVSLQDPTTVSYSGTITLLSE